MQSPKALSPIIQALYLGLFISLTCSFRAITSIVIVLLLIAGLVKNWMETKTLFNQNLKNTFLYGCVLFFLIHFIALLCKGNKQEGWLDLLVKTGVVLTPLAVCCTNFINEAKRKKLSHYFIVIVAAVALYCLGVALWKFYQSGDVSFFFYHLLVKPVNGHAGYYSVLVFIALLFLTEVQTRNDFKIRFLYVSLIIFLSIFLFLLSSKLVIGFYFLYLVIYFMALIKNSSGKRFLFIGLLILLISGSIIALTTTNPVSRRFSDIMNGNLKVLEMDKFNPGMYFNGIQFRLLQWRFTAEILNENDGWWIGVGPGNAQHLLDQKYISTNMYIGEPARGDHGFLGYNTHNQFLETLLKTGIPGVVVLLFICFTLIKMAWQQKKREIRFIVALLLIWLLTESVLERQYGILIFTFFPLFLLLDEK